MDPVAFTIPGLNLAVHWYGIIMVTGILFGTWIAARGVTRRGGNSEVVWDGLTWAMPAGVIGARAWYVVNDILGGSTRYLDDPTSILRIPEGGLHFYGGILFGGLTVYIFSRRRKIDMWMIVDSVGPALLIAQAVIRPANFINQELYGPPTDLPWGISIDAAYRTPPWTDIVRFPVETTRFHPTFAYEIVWNLLAAGILLWVTHRFWERMKPGVPFAGWLILAGLGRIIIEAWRPDQPRVPSTDLSYTRIASLLMFLAGVIMILIKYRVLRLSFLPPGRDGYLLPPAQEESLERPPEPEPAQTEGEDEDTLLLKVK